MTQMVPFVVFFSRDNRVLFFAMERNLAVRLMVPLP